MIKLFNDTKTTILEKEKCLKNVEEFKNVSISPDYSKAKRLKIKLLIKTRIELNKQLRAESPNANYYFSIKDGRIIMINKHNSAPHKTENVKTTNIESLTRKITEKMNRLDTLSSKVDRVAEKTNQLMEETIIFDEIFDKVKKITEYFEKNEIRITTGVNNNLNDLILAKSIT